MQDLHFCPGKVSGFAIGYYTPEAAVVQMRVMRGLLRNISSKNYKSRFQGYFFYSQNLFSCLNVTH